MRTALLGVLTLALCALQADADWLVMRDGTRLETQGPWTERGRLIVFTSATGDLSSLRAAAIDLAASRQATATATATAVAETSLAATAARAPQARREVRRITNTDIPAGRGTAAATAGANEGGQPAGTAPAVATRELQVRDTAQRIDPFDNHLVVSGNLANLSQQTAAAVVLTVQAYGADGELIGSTNAQLELTALRPGASTAFEADFADLYDSAMALRFAPAANFLETSPQDGSATTSGEIDDGFEDGDVDDFEDFDDPER